MIRMRGKLARMYASGGELDTPYKRAVAEWDNRIGSSVVQARNWRVAALIAGLGWLVVSAGLIVLAQRPPTLRLVTMDRDGVPVRQASAVAAADFKPTDMQVKHYLNEWLLHARRVSSDGGITKQGWVAAQNMTTGIASSQLKDYLKPFGAPDAWSRKVMVVLSQVNIIKVTDETFQADWREQRWTSRNPAPAETSYRGLHRIKLRPPTVDDPENAIGFFVAEFHWNQLR